jgi:hypothetical protein
MSERSSQHFPLDGGYGKRSGSPSCRSGLRTNAVKTSRWFIVPAQGEVGKYRCVHLPEAPFARNTTVAMVENQR